MSNNNADMASFRKAAKPLMKWLKANRHPHHIAIVQDDAAELVESQMLVLRKKLK